MKKEQTNQESRNPGINGDGPPSGRNDNKPSRRVRALIKRADRLQERVKMLVRRHLRLIAKGKSCFDQANTALAKAINCGLQVGAPIELEILGENGEPKKEQFYLVNNFDQDVVYKPARVAHYEFKKIPKTKRAPGPGVEAAVPAATEAAP